MWFTVAMVPVRINHFVLTTNTFLVKIKLKTNPLCTFCGKHQETMIHLLWECDKVVSLLDNFDKWLIENVHSSINYNKKSFIFGIINSKHSNVQNLILMQIKHYIYSCRCLNKALNLQGLQKSIKNLYEKEKYAALLAQNIELFDREWAKWQVLLDA